MQQHRDALSATKPQTKSAEFTDPCAVIYTEPGPDTPNDSESKQLQPIAPMLSEAVQAEPTPLVTKPEPLRRLKQGTPQPVVIL